MDVAEVIKAAQEKADVVAREALPSVSWKACPRCKGSGAFTYASGAVGSCASCVRGKVPATKTDRDALTHAAASRELRRLRILWAAHRDVAAAAPEMDAEAARAEMRQIEAHAAAIKADPRVVTAWV